MFESLTDKSKFDAQPELFIHIIPGKTRNLLTLIDSGIGMTKSDLVQRVAINDIEDFEAKYEGTDSEKKNLKDLYTKFKGNMNR
jgi:HSP90 family molecular chaperone